MPFFLCWKEVQRIRAHGYAVSHPRLRAHITHCSATVNV